MRWNKWIINAPLAVVASRLPSSPTLPPWLGGARRLIGLLALVPLIPLLLTGIYLFALPLISLQSQTSSRGASASD
jgi:hypothetical protein